jgi:hypothetical protein
MKKQKLIFISSLLFQLLISSCSCTPDEMLKAAFSGMEHVLGDGFFPSDEIRALGDFQSVSVNLHRTNEGSVIILKLENGDPKLLADYPDLLARKCADIYLRDFKNSSNYEKIIVRFVQTDVFNPDNYRMQEYEFQTKDFLLSSEIF